MRRPGPADRPKVVFLLQDLLFGGTQTQSLELARHLDRDALDLRIWTLISGNDLAEKVEPTGLRVEALSSRKTVGLSALARLARKLAGEKPDLLLLLTVVPNIWGRILGRLTKVPAIIATVRQDAALVRAHERFLARLPDHFICNAEALGRALVEEYGVLPERVTVIPNGVDTRVFRPGAQPEPGLILCPARLDPDKDHSTLLQAFELLAERRPEARLRLVGEGRLKQALAAEIERSFGDGRVRLLDGRPDLTGLYGRASVVTLASRHEGLPNVVLEAMAAGRPVVATRVGGVAEAIEPERTGLLVDPGDPVGLARAWERLLADPRLGREMGRRARLRAEAEFSLETSVAAHERLFERCLTASRARRG